MTVRIVSTLSSLTGGEKQARILDLTIRYEGIETQATDVDEEKRLIYEPYILDLKLKYRLAGFDVKVIGLYIGARGTIPKFFVDSCKCSSLPKDLMNRIVISVLKGSCSISHCHHTHNSPLLRSECGEISLSCHVVLFEISVFFLNTNG